MILPILISVSLAPVSYFFWARTAWDAHTKAAAAIAAAPRAFKRIVSPRCCSCPSGLSLEPGRQLLAGDRDLPRAVRHEEDDKEEQHAEHGAGQALGDAFGDVRDEDDEGRANKGTGQPADAADDRSEERRVGKECRSRW